MAPPERYVPLLLRREALAIPVAREQRLAGEERPNLGIARGVPLVASPRRSFRRPRYGASAPMGSVHTITSATALWRSDANG